MKIELIIIIVVLLIVANIYYDGKLFNQKIFEIFKKWSTWKKYAQISGVIFVGICIFLLFKKNPSQLYDLCNNANSYIKYIPIDKNTSNLLKPMISLTKNNLENSNYIKINNSIANNNYNNKRILNSGKNNIVNNTNRVKRSVSETKKKYVASQQDWKCKHCNIKLPAWFEVDHVIKLEYGGSNSVDNLEALCRDCHGKKTAMENL